MMIEVEAYPSARRVFLAFALTPVAGGLVLGAQALWHLHIIQALGIAVAVAIVYGYPVGIVIGVPVYLALKDTVRPTLLNCALVGTAIATIPMLFLMLPSLGGGWIDAGLFVAQTAAAGFVTGAVFWFVAACRIRGSQQA